MRKRLIYFLILVLLVGGYFLLKKPSTLSKSSCAFCNPDVLNRQTFYQDELCSALYTHKPILSGHCLIIPKRHVERFEELSKEEELQLAEVIKKVHQAAMQVFGNTGYLLLQKNGAEAGQSVPHVHFHYIPCKAQKGSILLFFLKMFLALLKGPINSTEMQEVIEKMQQAMNSISIL